MGWPGDVVDSPEECRAKVTQKCVKQERGTNFPEIGQ